MNIHRDESHAESGPRARVERGRIQPPSERESAEIPALADALSACCSALERSLVGAREEDPQSPELESLRPHVARFAAIAVDNYMPPERAIVMLKRMIRALPPITPWRDATRENISHKLVRMLIDEYFDLDGDASYSSPRPKPFPRSELGEPNIEIPFREL